MKPAVFSQQSKQMRKTTAMRVWACSILIGLGLSTSAALAQDSPSPIATSPAQGKAAVPQPGSPKPKPPPITKPSWSELTPLQQQALQPLAAQWAQLSAESKQKWLALSKNYASLSSAEQAKLHSRMSAWVSLSTNERTEARLNFAETKKLPPDEKAAHWQSYQELSAEEKRKLAAQAYGKPSGVAVIKPVQQRKLTEVPVTPHTPQQGSKLAGINQSVHPNTLLPQRSPPTDTSPTKKQ